MRIFDKTGCRDYGISCIGFPKHKSCISPLDIFTFVLKALGGVEESISAKAT